MRDKASTEPEADGSDVQPEGDQSGAESAKAWGESESNGTDAELESPQTTQGPQLPQAAKKSFDGAAFVRAAWVPALLVLLLGLTVAGIIVGLTAPQDDAFGKFCIIAAVPLLSIAIGFFGNRFFHDLGAKEALRKDVQMAAYTTYHVQSSVVYVDERVGYALTHLLEGAVDNALLNLVSAKTATELAFGVTQQSASQLEMISPTGASAAKNIFSANRVDARPKIIPGDEPKLGKPGER